MEMQGRRENDAEQPSEPVKSNEVFVESTEMGIPTTYADVVSSRISKAHRDYLMERHGTLELDPIPSMDAADPYNWLGWKVRSPRDVSVKTVS